MIAREHYFHLDCDCGQHCIVVSSWQEDEGKPEDRQMMALSYMTTYPITGSIWERLKVCWHIFRGREHTLYDIILRKSKLREFSEFINKCLTTYKPDL